MHSFWKKGDIHSMKIGLMTWFSYINYGTVLQVYSLYRYLSNKGHEVQVIRYYPINQPRYYKSTIDKLFSKGKWYCYRLTHSKEIVYKKCSASFNEFINNYLTLSQEVVTNDDFRNLNKEFDAFICGSDQIWSPLHLDSRYFLDFVEDTSKMISYAPSMGVTSIERPGDDKKIGMLTDRFKYLSVRERSAADIINKINGRNAKVVLDPTLLLSSDEWNSILPDFEMTRPYLLVYFLRENYSYWRKVKRIAKKMNLDIRVIPVFKHDLKLKGKKNGGNTIYVEDVDPITFVKLIKEASLVCTDSFHGMAFSINYMKNFIAFQRFQNNARDNQNSRVFNFLDILGLTSRMYRRGFDYKTQIDYGSVNNRLSMLRKESYDFLNESIEEIESNL